MGVFSKYLVQLLAGLLVLAVFAVAVQTVFLRTVRAERDRAVTERSLAVTANKALLKTIETIEAEKELSERLLAERMKAEARIRSQSQSRLEEKNRELARLRERYADVEEFLAIPVPPAFVAEWMRDPAGGNEN